MHISTNGSILLYLKGGMKDICLSKEELKVSWRQCYPEKIGDLSVYAIFNYFWTIR